MYIEKNIWSTQKKNNAMLLGITQVFTANIPKQVKKKQKKAMNNSGNTKESTPVQGNIVNCIYN